MVRNGRQGLGQLRFGRCEGRHGIRNKGIVAREHVRVRRPDERLDIVGVSDERAIEEAARLRKAVRAVLPLLSQAKP